MSEKYVNCEYCGNANKEEMEYCLVCHGTGKMLWIYKLIKPDLTPKFNIFEGLVEYYSKQLYGKTIIPTNLL